MLTLELADIPHDAINLLQVHIGLIFSDGILLLPRKKVNQREERWQFLKKTHLRLKDCQVGRDENESNRPEPQVSTQRY